MARNSVLKKNLDNILKEIAKIRNEIFNLHGVVIPDIRIKENDELNSLEYVIKVSVITRGNFKFSKNKTLIINLASEKITMDGKPCKEPAYGYPGLWIPTKKITEAITNGYTVLTYQKVIKVHMREIIEDNLSSVLTIQYVSDLLNEVSVDNPVLYKNLFMIYGDRTIAVIQKYLCSLLKERLSITDINTILESINTNMCIDHRLLRRIRKNLGYENNENNSNGVKDKLKQNLYKFNIREQKILKMRFGIDEDSCYTVNEVASVFNISEDEIINIETKALLLLKE